MKYKIFNDPVHGFISISDDLIFEIIEHKYFQRLRRIGQTGLTNLVYSSANHTRFSHAMGCVFLMEKAINSLKRKNIEISKEEEQAVKIAILLHDIGHGPYSHVLESSIVSMHHEDISVAFMKYLNREFDGKLSLAIDIFEGNYHKKFLKQLISSQLDIDRIDYIKRDAFFTGVNEGAINSERIINMLDVVDNELVVQEKGIYSVERFIMARRLMYWQVYLHKTSFMAEELLVRILKRAKFLFSKNKDLFATEAFKYFMKNDITEADFDGKTLNIFAKLDDIDILTSIKEWQYCDDSTLSYLSKCIINRNLYKIEIQKTKFSKDKIDSIKSKIARQNTENIDINELVFSGEISNYAYKLSDDKIKILFKTGEVKDITEASDNLNISALSDVVTKYYLCYRRAQVSVK